MPDRLTPWLQYFRRRRLRPKDSDDVDLPRTHDGYQVAKAGEGQRKGKGEGEFMIMINFQSHE